MIFAKLTMISGEKIHVWKPGNINIWVWKEEKHWKIKITNYIW